MKKTKENGSIVILVLSSLIVITTFVLISVNKANNKIVQEKNEEKTIQEEYKGTAIEIQEEMENEYNRINEN